MILEQFKVLLEIQAERGEGQDIRWGGKQRDDYISPDEWYLILDHYLNASQQAASPASRREMLVKLAAVAVAQIESIDRNGSKDSTVSDIAADCI